MNCRLLYLVGQLGPGGLEHQLYYLLKTMDRERYRPEVVVWNFRSGDIYVPQIQKLGVPLHHFPDTLSAAGKLSAFRRMVMRMRPEVIHSYTFYTNFAAWWAAPGTKPIAVGSVRNDFAHDKKSCGVLLGRLSARWPRAQIYNNFAGAKAARSSHSLFTPGQVFVVRNALDLRQFRKAPVSTNGRAHILGVGSLIQRKRWDRLLRAAAALKGSGLDFRVDIAGGGPLGQSLQTLAQDLGVLDRVRFAGHTDDVSALLARSTFLAHTSDSEGCPNVVMEAMACGRAVVATDSGDIPSLVEDGKAGFVVRRGDEDALADRMTKLITDHDLCRRMGEAGRSKAEREFGLDRLLLETLAAYRASGWKDS